MSLSLKNYLLCSDEEPTSEEVKKPRIGGENKAKHGVEDKEIPVLEDGTLKQRIAPKDSIDSAKSCAAGKEKAARPLMARENKPLTQLVERVEDHSSNPTSGQLLTTPEPQVKDNYP